MRSTNQLARGDVPMMALLGTLAATSGKGGNFGQDRRSAPPGGTQFGIDYQAQFGGYTPSFGYDYGAEAAAAIAPPPPQAMIPHGGGHPAHMAHGGHRPNPHDPRHHAQLLHAWEYMHGRHAHTAKRVALLNPNEHSDVKIEAYVFSLNPSQFSAGAGLVWGTLNGWTAFKNPQVAFRAERVFVNVAGPGLVYINTLQAANVNAQIGGIADAFSFSPLAMGSKISLPTLPPQNTMQVTGTWTNIVPAPFNNDTAFTLAIDFEGWATVIA
jgi:hypothetical protein